MQCPPGSAMKRILSVLVAVAIVSSLFVPATAWARAATDTEVVPPATGQQAAAVAVDPDTGYPVESAPDGDGNGSHRRLSCPYTSPHRALGGCLSLSRGGEVLSVLSVPVHLTTPPSQPPAAQTPKRLRLCLWADGRAY